MKAILTTLILTCFFFSSNGQNNNGHVPLGEAWIGFQTSFPQGQFSNGSGIRAGYGLNVGGLWNPSKQRNLFQIGLETGILFLDKDNKVLDNIPLKTVNTLFNLNAVLRLRVQTDSRIKPFVDITGGKKLIRTVSKYDNTFGDTFVDQEDNTVFNQRSDGNWTYGTAFGASYSVADFNIEMKFSYIAGGSLSYTDPKNIFMDSDGYFYYEPNTIRKTDMISLTIGCSYFF
jgi:hypothetical protein